MKTYTIPLFCLLIISCNELRYDKAPKKELEVPLQESLQGADALSSRPALVADLMGAFFWPSREYFRRGTELGYFDSPSDGALDYISYIERISHTIFLADDEFNKWTLSYLQRKRETTHELEKIAQEKEVIRSQIKAIGLKSKELKALKKTLTEGQAQEEEAIDRQISDLFLEKKELTQKLTPLKDRQSSLEKYVKEALAYQQEAGMVVQEALDPQAVSYMLDENHRKVVDQYGLPVRNIDEGAQVNWIKVYKESTEKDNTFDLHGEKIVIRLGHWAGQTYETLYRQNDPGEWTLHPESSIYDVGFSLEGVLTFKFRERDGRENETGRIFEFELQFSKFAGHFRLLGDIRVLVGEKVTRRGQLKVFFREGDTPQKVTARTSSKNCNKGEVTVLHPDKIGRRQRGATEACFLHVAGKRRGSRLPRLPGG
ncbi:MAG: hypothetical protein OXB88_00055, partial [Bacteriovoracales bacterium]|nr:hypothetical protein [Bacteriovoracales bacterium]